MKLSQLFSLYFLFACSCVSITQNEFEYIAPKIILPVKNVGGTYSFIDTSGLRINTDSFSNVIALPSDYIYLLKQNNKWGATFSDQKILDFNYDTIYKCGTAIIAQTTDSTFLFSARDLSNSVSFDKLNISVFNNDNQYYSINKKEKKGLIKYNGQVILDPKYDAIIKINKYFIFKDSLNTYGVINANGQIIIPPQNEFIYAYNDSVLRHRINNIWKYYKPNGKIFPISGKLELELMNLNFYKVYKNNKVFLYQYKSDKLLDVSQFENYYPISNNLISVLKDDKIGLVDINMELIIPFQYEEISLFKNDLLLVKSNQKYGLINLQNQSIISCDYDFITSSGNLIKTYKNGKAGLHKANGEQVITNSFKGFIEWHNLHISYNDRFYGVYDSDFKLISKPIYSTFTYLYKNNITIMKSAGKFTIYNKKGIISEEKIDQFTITNNTIKTYKGKDIEIITVNSNGDVTEHERYPNMISVKINEKVKDDTYSWYERKYFPASTFLYQSQLQGKWGIKYRFDEGYKTEPTYRQIYPTNHSKIFIVKDSIKPYTREIGSIKFQVNELLSIIDNSRLYWKQNTFIDVHSSKHQGINSSPDHVMVTDTLGNSFIANNHLKTVVYSDEFLTSNVKRFNTGGILTISSAKTFGNQPSVSNYFNRINTFSNLTIEDSNSKKEVFNQSNFVNVFGGKWFYIDYGKMVGKNFINYFTGIKEFDKANIFNDNRTIAFSNGKAGVLNLKNETIIPFEYSKLEEIKSRKFTYFKSGIPNYGSLYIKKNKQLIFPSSVSIVKDNSSGFIYIHNGKYGIMDNNGKVKTCAQYSFLENVKSSKVIIARKDSFGLITNSGEELCDFKYSLITRKSDSLFLAFIGNQKLILNAQGKQILPFKHKLKQCDFDLILTKNNDSLHLFNQLGVKIFSSNKARIKILSKELISIKIRKKIKIYNLKTALYIGKKKTLSAKSIKNGAFIHCTSKNGHSILKNDGYFLLKNQQKIKGLNNGWFAAKNNKTWCIYNDQGKKQISNISKIVNPNTAIIEFIVNDELKSIDSEKNNLPKNPPYEKVEKSDKTGLISFTNKILLPMKFHQIELFYDNIFYVQDDNTEAYYIIKNKKARLIWQRNLPRYKEEGKFNCNF